MPFPTNALIIEYPIKYGIRRTRYQVTFRQSDCKISFKDKGLKGIDPRVRKRGNHMIVDPYVSKEQFIIFVKDYMAVIVGCHHSKVTLQWEKWFPLWGEPKQ